MCSTIASVHNVEALTSIDPTNYKSLSYSHFIWQTINYIMFLKLFSILLVMFHRHYVLYLDTLITTLLQGEIKQKLFG